MLGTAVIAFIPSVTRERRDWLRDRLTEAHMAALSVAAAPGGRIDPMIRNELLQLSGTEAVRVRQPDGTELLLRPDRAAPPVSAADLDQEDMVSAARRALADLVRSDDRLIEVSGAGPFNAGARIDLVLRERRLHAALREYAWHYAQVALAIAAVTGALVYLALLSLLVRPMRRLTGSIAAFRADPEHVAPLELPAGRRGPAALRRDDEMAVAGRELAAMQRDLRAALWRNARLAALGTAMAKVSHDLRGILSPALLTAEALQMNPEPAVRRAGDTLVRSVDRATDLVGRMLDYAADDPSPASRDWLALRGVIDEAADAVRAAASSCVVRNELPPGLRARADRNQVLRVVVNLIRNASEAGARGVRVRVAETDAPAPPGAVEIADDGPGLPDAVRATLFRPFTSGGRAGGSGLGLAIARDLMRAHGGDIQLAATGPEGTVFRLLLPGMETDAPGA